MVAWGLPARGQGVVLASLEVAKVKRFWSELYLAENRDIFSEEQDEVQKLALTQWKEMDKEVKDQYKKQGY